MAASVGEKAPGCTLPTERRENTNEGPLLFYQVGRPETVRAEPQRTAFPFLAGFDRRAMEDHGATREDGFQERTCVIDREEVEFSTTLEAVLEVMDTAL